MSRSLSDGRIDSRNHREALSENRGYPQPLPFGENEDLGVITIFSGPNPCVSECILLCCDRGRYPGFVPPGMTDNQCRSTCLGWLKCKINAEALVRICCFSMCPGRFQNGNSDEGICIACPLGQFRSASSAACEACAVDHFADEPGLSACKPCPEQSEQAQMGQSACACQAQAAGRLRKHETFALETHVLWGIYMYLPQF